MGQVPQQLGGALGPGAADVGPVLVPLHGGPAHGAHRWEHIGDGPLGPLLPYHGQNLRDDLPRLAHQHRVPDAHVLLRNKILVVEGGVGDGGPRQPHRLQHCLGGEHPGAAHLNDDVHHLGGLHLRGILVGRRPPGKFRRAAQGLPLAQIVDLDDRPVDVKGELLPVLPDGGHLVHRLLNGGGAVMGNHFKVLGFQIVQCLQVGVERLPLRPLDVKDRNIQLPGGGHLGVQLPQRAGGGVSGVCKEGLSPSLPLLVEGVEHLFGHIDLPPDNELAGGVRDAQGDGLHRPQVFGHVLPHLAVPPGGAPDKQAVLILQGHGQAVHLGLHVVYRVGDHALHPLVELAQLVVVKYVLEGLQGHLVDHLLEGLQRLSTDSLGRRIWSNKLRVGPLQLLQPAELVVVVVVRHTGVILYIVLVVGLLQLPAKGLDLLLNVHQSSSCV